MKLHIFFIILSFLLLINVETIFAQEQEVNDPLIESNDIKSDKPTPIIKNPEGVAEYISINDEGVVANKIVVLTQDGYALSSSSYDEKIVGVVAEKPSMEINMMENQDTYPVITSGKATLEVNSENGNIKKGDMITTSSKKGVGMKATEPGFVIGSALESYSSKDATKVGKITVLLSLKFSAEGKDAATTDPTTMKGQMKNLFNLSKIASSQNPVLVLRYLAAGAIIIATFVITFFTFERIANNGLKALGRNPMAGKLIGMGIFLNVFVASIMIAIGLFISYIILTV
jgi:hypothetical protein